MDLRRLAIDIDARHWRAPLLLACMLVAAQLPGASAREALRYERDAVLAGGEYLRLLTAHLCHYDLAHLGWNLAGLGLVAWLFVREYSVREWLLVLLVSTVVIDAGFLLLEPQLEWYVGFSGVLQGLMAAGLLSWWQRQRDAVTIVVTAVFAGKLAWEHAYGALPFTAGTLAVPVVHAAHSYGALGGAAAAAWISGRRRRGARSL